MIKPRELALKILADIEKNQAYLNISFQEKTQGNDLSLRDVAFVKELVYGVVKHKITLDYTISRYSSVKIKKLSAFILCILRMGLYQLFYMDKVPQSAAVNESVKLAGKYGHGASRGYVNAMLRKMASERGYEVLTLVLRGDVELLHKRYLHRMQNENRHPVHLSTTLDVFEDFKGYTEYGRSEAIPGEYIEINANDFSYQTDMELLSKIDKFMK